jgi:arylsulfatase A-like enzyme
MTGAARRPPVDGSVIVVLADGARPDLIESARKSERFPAIRRLIEEGGSYRVTSTFPSVTGPAYTPFLMGRYPGSVGLPGLRWYDRARRAARLPGHSRSYVGHEMRHVDSDLDPAAPTIFELVSSSVAARSVITRGLSNQDRIGRELGFVARTAMTHFSGKVTEWLKIDRSIAAETVERIRIRRPQFAFIGLIGIDKTSHAVGHRSAEVDQALSIVDETVASLRHDAERDGRWDRMHLWIASDHGHSSLEHHDEIADFIRRLGFRVVSHPWAARPRGEVAVMVSGNSMAHVYVDLANRSRQWWPTVHDRWKVIPMALLARESVDLMILPKAPGACEVHGRGRGHAVMGWKNQTISYQPVSGDPLAVGAQQDLSGAAAYEVTREGDYPDSLVQIAALSDAPRSGDIILSAAREWDFRERYEPIPHVSSHGGLHRDHMLVPLIVNRPVASLPRRTADVMPSALTALGIDVPNGLDGRSFL